MVRAERWGVWTLRSHLSALLMVTMLLTLALVGGAVLALGVPRIERESRLALRQEVREMAQRMESLLGARQTRLELLEALLHDLPDEQADALLDKGVAAGSNLRVVYRVSAQGKVLAVGLPDDLQGRRADLLGSDLSANGLVRAVADRSGTAWRGRTLSALTGDPAAGLAMRDREGRVLVAEVPFDALLSTVAAAASGRASSIWIVDRGGEIIADTGRGDEAGKLNILNWPLMQALLQDREAEQEFRLHGRDFHVAMSRSEALDWHFVGHAPVGLANPQVQALVLYVVAAFASCAVIGLLIAPFWASRMVRPLLQVVARAEQTTAGGAQDLPWPRGPVAEFNRLSGDLERMALALQEREQKFLAIFNASPVPMSVQDADDDFRFLDVNQVWCRELGYDRAEVLGRTALDFGLWDDPAKRSQMLARLPGEGPLREATLRRKDGSPILAQLFGQMVPLPSGCLAIGVCLDVGPIRRIEHALRELNQQLEARVARRTQALAAAHDALTLTVAQQRTARDELVRSEKMAALGHLVAGVAHELNTPLGNGVMAISALADAAHRFQAGSADGLKRADLLQLIDSVEQGADIAERNLRRAADLVHSFKQVAVDQTSAQRRSFELGEVVHEIVVSLRPSFSRTPYRIVVDVPATGLRLDGYPGALGQAVANLIQNAVLHGFDGRDRGTVTLSGWHDAGDGRVVLRVADDGRGIAAAVLPRIFEPFMTTRMGRGGTGLGLHISYNAVVNLLGGTLTVHSEEGHGAVFELRLPPRAPQPPPGGNGEALAGKVWQAG